VRRLAGLCLRHDGVGASEGRSSGVGFPQIGGVASDGFRDPWGRSCEAQSGVGQGGDGVYIEGPVTVTQMSYRLLLQEEEWRSRIHTLDYCILCHSNCSMRECRYHEDRSHQKIQADIIVADSVS
jgi:hypothetical protein